MTTMFFRTEPSGACLLMLAVDAILFRGNVRTFRREEILTRWK